MTGFGAGSLVFDPLLPPLALVLAALVLALGIGLSFWRGLRGKWLRAVAGLVLIAALCGPALKFERRERLNDIVLLVTDESASQSLPGRPEQLAEAEAALEAQLKARPGTELRKITVGDAPEDGGTLALTALARAIAEEPKARIAGAILLSDGQVHDEGLPLDLPAPLSVLLTGQKTDWDRRLTITKAPAFGIIGEETQIGLRIDELGAMPGPEKGRAVDLSIAIDGGEPMVFTVDVGTDLEMPLMLDHAGANVVQFTIAGDPGELTLHNNTSVVQINGVRDRLRVLLVSGEPYAGERTWRNLLKSDSAVDLVHFTILRPPEKEDGVPVDELALIAFPTRELFVEKIDDFDLIIFDRYALRGILPPEYLDNIRNYVLGGGAVLVAAGVEFASVESLYFSGLGEVLPAAPTAQVIDAPYRPALSTLGQRHPVTEGLEEASRKERGSASDAKAPAWGRWLRYVEVVEPQGSVLMEGPGQKPLLVLNRAGEGRVALLASDQAWLWTRGFEGGGPQQELLRRLAHWLMKEPELEEEALTAVVKGQEVAITRRSVSEGARKVTIVGPDGAEVVLDLAEGRPGVYSADWVAPASGLYRLKDGDLERVFVVGPPSPREFADAVPTEARLKAAVAPTNGGFVRIEDGIPKIRDVRPGRPAVGRGWIGLTPREAYRTLDLRLQPLLPDWVWMLALALWLMSAWIYEGQRRRV